MIRCGDATSDTRGLLGAETLFTGITAEMAQMLVELDIDLQEFRSVATLEAGIEAVLNRDAADL